MVFKKLLLSYLVVFAVFNLGGFDSSDIMLGVLFAAVYSFITHLEKMTGRTASPFWAAADLGSVWPHIIAAVWTLLYALYAGEKLAGGLENRLFIAVYTFLTLAGIYVLIMMVSAHIISAVSSFDIAPETGTAKFPFKLMFLYAACVFACIIPLFLINAPGTLTVDSYYQLSQAVEMEPYTDQHPWIHTLMIKILFHIGFMLTHSAYAGIGLYTVVQMILCSFAVAYVIASMAQLGLKRTLRILIFLGYILYPYNTAYAITMWKDVLFSASVLVLLITLYRIGLAMSADIKIPVRDIAILAVSGTGTCLLRHNGFYAFILTALVLIIRAIIRKQMRLIVALAAVIAAAALIKGPVRELCGVEKSEFAYNIPIPLQQIARVIHDGGEISAEDMEMIERINISDYLKKEYTPGGADPTEQWLIFGDSRYLESHKAEYLALWIRIGLKNPVLYLRAYTDVTKGYYTTMPPDQTEFYGMLPNWCGLGPQPIVGHYSRTKINEIIYKLHNILPVYGILYSPGACMQLMILGVAIISSRSRWLYKRGAREAALLEKNKYLVYLPVLAIMATILIAAPLRADLRYAYPLMISMPLLTVVTLWPAGCADICLKGEENGQGIQSET